MLAKPQNRDTRFRTVGAIILLMLFIFAGHPGALTDLAVARRLPNSDALRTSQPQAPLRRIQKVRSTPYSVRIDALLSNPSRFSTNQVFGIPEQKNSRRNASSEK
jgi:hypothetical protein